MVGREVDGPLCAVLGRSWDLCWRSWAALGLLQVVLGRLRAYVDGLGPILGPMLTVLGCSRGIYWRSGAALGPKQAVWGRPRGVC